MPIRPPIPSPPRPPARSPAPPFEVGDPNGHADPFGAKAAGQARASRIKDAATYPQPAHGRQRIETGDFVLINDRIAVVIEDKGLSDGYGRFGGEILAIDKVGTDGRPMGMSKYNETLMGIAFDTMEPTSVTVLKDGSDGKEAVVRVTGPIEDHSVHGRVAQGALPEHLRRAVRVRLRAHPRLADAHDSLRRAERHHRTSTTSA